MNEQHPSNQSKDVVHDYTTPNGEFLGGPAFYSNLLRAAESAASRDELTGLLRGRVWENRVQQHIDHGAATAIFMIDLVKFKEVNDTLGHNAGDQVLATVGSVFTKVFSNKFRRDTDVMGHEVVNGTADEGSEAVIGRPGGDEFLLAVDIAANHKRGPNMTLAEKTEKELTYLRGAITEVQSQLEAQGISGIDASIGYAIFDPANPRDLPTLMHEADMAMFEDKRSRGHGR